MNKVRITAIRQTVYQDLMAKYENPIEHTCDVREGQQWISIDGQQPEGMCPSAWSSMREFVESLARGEGNFFAKRSVAPDGSHVYSDGWMKNPMSAMISCNDGFRPFSFYIEVINDPETKPTKDIYFAGGCFWGTEHYFKQIEGVAITEVGFANGHTENPTYKEVYTDTTGFAETVFVRFYPDVVSLEFLLQMFFKAIDPTSLNKQGHDEGTRYRTGVYYTDPADLPVIEKVFAEEQKNYEQPLAVEKLPLQNFYTAEEYHQDYLDKNPDGYCHLPLSLFEFARKAKSAKTSD